MSNNITYTKPVSTFKKISGVIIFTFAFYAIFYMSILGGFFMIAFAVYLASTLGSQFNLDTKLYRNIWSIFGIHVGIWKTSPDFEYISVFRGKQTQRVNSMSASTKFSEEIFLVNLFYERNKHATFYRTFDKEDAFKTAQHFKLVFDIDILDATEKEQKWMDE